MSKKKRIYKKRRDGIRQHYWTVLIPINYGFQPTGVRSSEISPVRKKGKSRKAALEIELEDTEFILNNISDISSARRQDLEFKKSDLQSRLAHIRGRPPTQLVRGDTQEELLGGLITRYKGTSMKRPEFVSQVLPLGALDMDVTEQEGLKKMRADNIKQRAREQAAIPRSIDFLAKKAEEEAVRLKYPRFIQAEIKEFPKVKPGRKSFGAQPWNIPLEELQAKSRRMLRSPRILEQARSKQELITLQGREDALRRLEKPIWGHKGPRVEQELEYITQRQHQLRKRVPKKLRQWRGRDLAIKKRNI